MKKTNTIRGRPREETSLPFPCFSNSEVGLPPGPGPLRHLGLSQATGIVLGLVGPPEASWALLVSLGPPGWRMLNFVFTCLQNSMQFMMRIFE